MTLLVVVMAIIMFTVRERRSPILRFAGGIVAGAFGFYWISQNPDHYIYILTGIACCVIGVYMMLNGGEKLK